MSLDQLTSLVDLLRNVHNNTWCVVFSNTVHRKQKRRRTGDSARPETKTEALPAFLRHWPKPRIVVQRNKEGLFVGLFTRATNTVPKTNGTLAVALSRCQCARCVALCSVGDRLVTGKRIGLSQIQVLPNRTIIVDLNSDSNTNLPDVGRVLYLAYEVVSRRKRYARVPRWMSLDASVHNHAQLMHKALTNLVSRNSLLWTQAGLPALESPSRAQTMEHLMSARLCKMVYMDILTNLALAFPNKGSNECFFVLVSLPSLQHVKHLCSHVMGTHMFKIDGKEVEVRGTNYNNASFTMEQRAILNDGFFQKAQSTYLHTKTQKYLDKHKDSYECTSDFRAMTDSQFVQQALLRDIVSRVVLLPYFPSMNQRQFINDVQAQRRNTNRYKFFKNLLDVVQSDRNNQNRADKGSLIFVMPSDETAVHVRGVDNVQKQYSTNMYVTNNSGNVVPVSGSNTKFRGRGVMLYNSITIGSDTMGLVTPRHAIMHVKVPSMQEIRAEEQSPPREKLNNALHAASLSMCRSHVDERLTDGRHIAVTPENFDDAFNALLDSAYAEPRDKDAVAQFDLTKKHVNKTRSAAGGRILNSLTALVSHVEHPNPSQEMDWSTMLYEKLFQFGIVTDLAMLNDNLMHANSLRTIEQIGRRRMDVEFSVGQLLDQGYNVNSAAIVHHNAYSSSSRTAGECKVVMSEVCKNTENNDTPCTCLGVNAEDMVPDGFDAEGDRKWFILVPSKDYKNRCVSQRLLKELDNKRNVVVKYMGYADLFSKEREIKWKIEHNLDEKCYITIVLWPGLTAHFFRKFWTYLQTNSLLLQHYLNRLVFVRTSVTTN